MLLVTSVGNPNLPLKFLIISSFYWLNNEFQFEIFCSGWRNCSCAIYVFSSASISSALPPASLPQFFVPISVLRYPMPYEDTLHFLGRQTVLLLVYCSDNEDCIDRRMGETLSVSGARRADSARDWKSLAIRAFPSTAAVPLCCRFPCLLQR